MRGGLTFPTPPFRAYREAAKGGCQAACPHAPPFRANGEGKGRGRCAHAYPFPRAQDGAVVKGGEGLGAKGGGMPSCSPLSREWGREGPACPRMRPFRAYRAPRPKEEGDGPGVACPRVPPFRAYWAPWPKGEGPGRRALPSWEGGLQTTGYALVRPPFRADMVARMEKGGTGGGGHRAPARKRGGQDVPLLMRLPVRAQTEAGAQRGGSGPAWSPSWRRAKGRRGGSPEREGGGKWGPTVPAPVPPLRENRGGGSKGPFLFPRKRRRGARGGGGPRSCILFSRSGGGQREKGEAQGRRLRGAQRGVVQRAATRGVAPHHAANGARGKGGHKGRDWWGGALTGRARRERARRVVDTQTCLRVIWFYLL
ncbi:hypothetical protein EDB85DRAFT_2250414 [Lactarius pseudohatsudake]|nr:hypothetical protein EDB85DRAFT_2250414 [Lactarius pseudohatsudake]